MLLWSAFLIFSTAPLAIAEIVETSRPMSFSWSGNFSSNDVLECDQIQFSLQVAVSGSASEPIPTNLSSFEPISPIIVRAYPPGGTPMYTSVTESALAALWQVAIPGDTQLLVSLYDSGSGQGGVQGVFRVISPPSVPGCSVPTPTQNSTDFNVVSNNTSPNACDPVSLKVTGGVKPYNLSFVVQDDQEYTATMGPNDDEYVWIANAVSNRVLLVSASDATGKLAVSTGLFLVNNASTNASNFGCPGQQSFSRQSSSSNPISNPKGTPVGAIVGGVVGGLAAIVIAILLLRYLRGGPRSKGKQLDDGAQEPAITHGVPGSTGFESEPLSVQNNTSTVDPRGSRIVGNTVVGGVEPESMVQVIKPGFAILAPPKASAASQAPPTATSTQATEPPTAPTDANIPPTSQTSTAAPQPSQPALQEVDAGPAPPAYGNWDVN